MNPAGMMVEHGGASNCLLLLLLLGREQEPTGGPTLLPQVVPLLLGIARVRKAHLLAIYGNGHVVVVISGAVRVAQPGWCYDAYRRQLVYVAVAAQTHLVRRHPDRLLRKHVDLCLGISHYNVLAHQVSATRLVHGLGAQKVILLQP